MTYFLGTHSHQFGLSFSLGHDPFQNLAIEEWLLRDGLRNLGHKKHLYLYRNGPCVVSGRFQVPWKEINFKSPLFNSIPYVRRKSGGGCVYHDLGNWNFCFFHEGKDLKREDNLSFIIEAVKKCGVELSANERFDLVHFTDRPLKVTGSAFKQTKDFSYHHGTLLIEARLKDLKGLLGMTEGWSVEGKGIPSVPSPVTNLRDHGFSGDFGDFIQVCCEQWGMEWSQVLPYFDGIEEEVNKYARALRGDTWRWGETPKHVLRVSGDLELEIEKGRVIRSDTKLSETVGHCVQSLDSLELLGPDIVRDSALYGDLEKILLKNSL